MENNNDPALSVLIDRGRTKQHQQQFSVLYFLFWIYKWVTTLYLHDRIQRGKCTNNLFLVYSTSFSKIHSYIKASPGMF